MKNPIYLFLLIIPFFVLSACGGNEVPSLDERIEVVDIEGTLTTNASAEVYQKGTHKIQTVGADTIYIQSPTINLSDYVDEEVRVKGKMTEGLGAAESVLTVSEIEYLEPKEEVVEINFKTYENQNFGLSFDHPSQWILFEGHEAITLTYQEEEIARVTIFSDETDVDAFAGNREVDVPVEVTVGAQRSLRYASGSNLTFYVPNPPKNKIYQIKFTPTLTEGVQEKKALFLDLIQSVESMSRSGFQGQICGGEPRVDCPENFFCQLNDGAEFATGVCAPVGKLADLSQCPRLNEPTQCEFQIADYNEVGCPVRYECIDGAKIAEDPSEEVDANDFAAGIGFDYVIPTASQVTQEVVNEGAGFSMKIPSDWYYANAQSGSDLTVGFLNQALESPENALVTMTVQDFDGGQASVMVGDKYYVFDGPSDLVPLMQTMAGTIEAVEVVVEVEEEK